MRPALKHEAIEAFKQRNPSLDFEIERVLVTFLEAFETGMGASLLRTAYDAGDWTFLELACDCIDWHEALQSITNGKHHLSCVETRVLLFDGIGRFLDAADQGRITNPGTDAVPVLRQLESVFYHTLDAVFADGPQPQKYTLPDGIVLSARMIAFLKAARKEHNLRQKRAREGAQKVKSAVEQAAGRSASFMDASKALAADATCRGIFYKRRTSMRRFKFYAPVDEAALAEAGFIVQPGPSYYDFCRLVFVPREAERRITNDVVNVPIAEWFLSRPRHRIKRAP